MKLSIITINLNNYDGLKRTMQSVVGQSFRDFEWIVVDGGSTDGSKELLEEYSESITKWISEPDKGIYNAMNKGIRMAEGEYLLFLNSGDSLLNETVLEDVIPYLNEADCLVGNISDSNLGNITHVDNNSLQPGSLLYNLINYSLPHQGTFFRSSIFEQYGLYREDFTIVSDWIFFVDTLLLGRASLKYIPVIVSLFDGNGISRVNPQKRISERNRYMKERPLLLLIRDLLDFHLKNYEIIDALESNKLVYFLFRIYFYFKRKFQKKRNKSRILSRYNPPNDFPMK